MRSEYVSNRFIFNIENSNRNDIKNKNLYLWFSFFWPHFIPFAWFSTFIVQTTKRNVLIKIHVSQPGWWRELNSWIIRWCDVKLSQYDVAMELQYRGLSWLIPKRVDSCSSIGYGCKLASHGAKKTEMCLKKKEKKTKPFGGVMRKLQFSIPFYICSIKIHPSGVVPDVSVMKRA